MTALLKMFGVATRNFTAYPEIPDARALVDYGVRVEALGYDSVWVGDSLLARPRHDPQRRARVRRRLDRDRRQEDRVQFAGQGAGIIFDI